MEEPDLGLEAGVVRGSKTSPCYRLHGYWAKKDPGAVARLIIAATRP